MKALLVYKGLIFFDKSHKKAAGPMSHTASVILS